MNAEQNVRSFHISPGTPCSQLLYQCRQPSALVNELNLALVAHITRRPIKAVGLLGQHPVLFTDAIDSWHLHQSLTDINTNGNAFTRDAPLADSNALQVDHILSATGACYHSNLLAQAGSMTE